MIEIAKISDINKILKFIKENWNKNHIFVKKPKLLMWQHNVYKKNYSLDYFHVSKNCKHK